MTVQIFATTTACFLPDKQEELVIFCVGQELRRVAAFRVWAAHRHLDVRSLIGSYNGITETSFVVVATDYAEVAIWTRAEESILFLGLANQNGDRPARLVFADGHVEGLGCFVSGPRNAVLASHSWTYDPAADQDFTCAKDGSREHAVPPLPRVHAGAYNPTEAAG